LLNVFFFSHAAGLLVSTHSREARRAHAAAGTLLVAYFIGIPLLAMLLQYRQFPATAALLEMFSPAFACQEAGTVGTRFNPYWRSLLLVHLNAWLFLAVASLALPRCWQDKPVKTDTRWRTRLRQWCYGPPAAREALRLRLIGTNPFLWLVSRNRLGQITVWGVLGVIACGWVWIWLTADMRLRDAMLLFVMIILLYHGVLKFWMASEACSHLSEQRRSGALEYLLCCTPLSVPEILRGQWLALRRRFLRPMIAVLALDVVLMALSLTRAAANSAEEEGYFIVCVFAAMLMLLADAAAIGWVGMWQAMVEKKPRTAAGTTISRILILPWLIFGLICSWLGMMGRLDNYDSRGLALYFWFILGIVIDASFGLAAREKLLTQFRVQAARQPEESLGILGRLGRFLGKMAG
jgi:hypothetical protein